MRIVNHTVTNNASDSIYLPEHGTQQLLDAPSIEFLHCPLGHWGRLHFVFPFCKEMKLLR